MEPTLSFHVSPNKRARDVLAAKPLCSPTGTLQPALSYPSLVRLSLTIHHLTGAQQQAVPAPQDVPHGVVEPRKLLAVNGVAHGQHPAGRTVRAEGSWGECACG